ncbi:UDP-N-acetylmuramate--L-alanine ligase [Mangrovibacterium marinum]|uniref:UDP-N-acetylmuramate: L-alanyl-gamma-D-glutamyl-meso-diaminopimelate ligase n=1 Tax=Mangrovibacterium marinum TaxID=1639118 RepID=A0A2T5C135_9BACT|nr:Mur ligase family protein [Mangrovibacterium marinum]PTN08322.1 UDP-N-acetylmuramate: L-alanyl-gamma-D-glutamyl-meso-diaminopimelate ligase [Mangrovibacterium marinum]
MRIHFIAIGGSAMHNLAIALHKKGFEVSGSDDEIFEPSKGRLEQYGLLPEDYGWHPEKLSTTIDAVILGMHARPDNPELLKAQQLGLKIYSYPEYLYEQTKDKLRVVVGGSHGKTSITSMIMHVLKCNGVQFDYMVGAKLDGFDTMVSLSHESRIAVFEGDEYLSSPIDRRPKFHLYHPHIALLSGIAWDHINVFPTFENYVEQFRLFADLIEKDGKLFYYGGDRHLCDIAGDLRADIRPQAYREQPSCVEDGITYLTSGNDKYRLQVFGDHNLQNIAGAKLVCNELGIGDEAFFSAMAFFKGAARRLEVLAENGDSTVFYDFAHSPSKLKATTEAVKKQFGDRKLIAVMELHTFSSLKKEFLPQYEGCMAAADEAYVYFNPQTIVHKQLEPITKEQVAEAFASGGLQVFTDSDELFARLQSKDWSGKNLLIMTSGNFSGKDVKELAESLCSKS